jgi:hypothetical protein
VTTIERVRKIAATAVALLIAACGGSGGDGGGGDAVDGVPGSTPSLTITQPLDGSLALTTVPIDVRCVDDRPGCQVDVRYYTEYCTGRGCTVDVREYSDVLARGTAGLATTLDLAAFAGSQQGQDFGLEFRATDSGGQVTTESRTVYVELPGQLTPIRTVGGDIADFDGTRLLYFTSEKGGDHPAIYSLSTGVTEIIPLDDGWDVSWFRGLAPYNEARLTPDGAVFRADRLGGDDAVFLWRSGTLTLLPNSESAYELFVAGPFAIWPNGVINSPLYRVDTRTGVSELVEPSIRSRADVAADGTVVLIDQYGRLISDRAGQRTILVGANAGEPRIEGSSVAFNTVANSRRSLWLMLNGAAPILLVETSSSVTLSSTQLAGGWVAFTDNAPVTSPPQVYRRDPQGTISQITHFADLGGILERLAPNGDAMIYRGSGRYLSRGTTLTRIRSNDSFDTRTFWFDGQWYIAMGATLARVDTSGM